MARSPAPTEGLLGEASGPDPRAIGGIITLFLCHFTGSLRGGCLVPRCRCGQAAPKKESQRLSWPPLPESPPGPDRALAAETAALAAVSTGIALPIRAVFPGENETFPRESSASAVSAEADSDTIRVDADQAAEKLRRATLRHLNRGCGAEVGISSSSREIAAALRLVHDVYVGEGYMEPHPLGMRILLPHHAVKSTTVVSARREGEVVGTLTLLFDGAVGLPMDELYPEALTRARRAGRRIVEVGNFAIAKHVRGTAILMHLMRAAVRLAMAERQDDLVIAVHPKHATFYRTIWLMERFGEVTPYSEVKGAPAIGLRGDLKNAPELLLFFYGWLPRDRNLFTFVFDSSERQQCH